MADQPRVGVAAAILVCEEESLAEDLAHTLQDLGYDVHGPVASADEAEKA